MDKKHYNELILLSQEIYDEGITKLTDYCTKTYGCSLGTPMERQLEDYLFVAEETSAFFLGNALALLDPGSQEEEIKTFVDNLRRVIAFAQAQLGTEQKNN